MTLHTIETEQPQEDSLERVLLVRQPICRPDRQLFGFDLLCEGTVSAWEILANVFLSVGVKKLAGNRPIFIKMDRKMFTAEHADCLPNRSLVLELPADIEATSGTIDLCRSIKRLGHSIAVRTEAPDWQNWLALADYLRIDIGAPNAETDVRVRRPTHVKAIADHVDTNDELRKAAGLGFQLCSGGFLALPAPVNSRALKGSYSVQRCLLTEVLKDSIDLGKVARLISQDVALTLKLLCYLNSAAFAWRSKIKSVQHAISLLGEDELRKWTCLAMVTSTGQSRNSPLLVKCLVRARFGELITAKVESARSSSMMFLLGLLSMLDAILQVPMEELLNDLNLDDRIRDTLMKTGKTDSTIRWLYALIETYDEGDWVRSMAIMANLGLNHRFVLGAYIEAVEWAEQISQLA